MASRIAIDLEASLQCEFDGQPLAVSAHRGVIVVSVVRPTSGQAISMFLRHLRFLRSNVSKINRVLDAISHRLELRVDGVLIASMGHETESGLLRLVGMRQVRFWPFRLLRRPFKK